MSGSACTLVSRASRIIPHGSGKRPPAIRLGPPHQFGSGTGQTRSCRQATTSGQVSCDPPAPKWSHPAQPFGEVDQGVVHVDAGNLLAEVHITFCWANGSRYPLGRELLPAARPVIHDLLGHCVTGSRPAGVRHTPSSTGSGRHSTRSGCSRPPGTRFRAAHAQDRGSWY